MKTIKTTLLVLISTVVMHSHAQMLPEYPKPFHTVPVYSNINAELIQRSLKGELITPLQGKIVSCSFYTDQLGQYMQSRQSGYATLNDWLDHPETTKEQARKIAYVYSFPEGTTMASRINNLRVFVESTFANCIAIK